MNFSICVLLYGNHPDLTHRCLSSLAHGIPWNGGRVGDFRIGLNAVCEETKQYVESWAKYFGTRQHPVHIWESDVNRSKYPVMRRMFWEGPELAPLVMWFDDDSYLTEAHTTGWIDEAYAAIEPYDMAGQYKWHMPMKPRQWDWIKTQPWYNPTVGLPPLHNGRHMFKFIQGGWWMGKRDFLRQHDYPWPELRHNGGDSMLGEMCRHVGARLNNFSVGVKINAGSDGRDSSAPRRGDTSDQRIGANYIRGLVPDLSHQDFCMPYRTVYEPEERDNETEVRPSGRDEAVESRDTAHGDNAEGCEGECNLHGCT